MKTSFEILLVEDNPGDVFLTREAFRESGFSHRLSVAENGEEALKFLRRKNGYRDCPRPDVILLDLNLPRVDGREVLAELKTDPALKSIPVIVLSTSNAEKDVSVAYGLHANCYLIKPLLMDEFLGKIRLLEEFWLHTARLPSPS